MALFMIFYKGKHGPIDDFLERKTYTIGCTTHGRTYPIIYIDYRLLARQQNITISSCSELDGKTFQDPPGTQPPLAPY